jgi:hypothetical protein
MAALSSTFAVAGPCRAAVPHARAPAPAAHASAAGVGSGPAALQARRHSRCGARRGVAASAGRRSGESPAEGSAAAISEVANMDTLIDLLRDANNASEAWVYTRSLFSSLEPCLKHKNTLHTLSTP